MKKGYLLAGLVLCAIAFSTQQGVRYPYSESAIAVDSPSDHILASDVHVYGDHAVIAKDNLQWARVEDTHSMEPTLNKNSISLEETPTSPDAIKVGDIISFNDGMRIIIHRVVSIGTDENGWFALTKGDNNTLADPGKVRFGAIKGIVVGILY